VTVCDPYNRPVTGLEKEHFRILDDKVEQTITHFAMDDEPVAVGLVFDISGSMGPKLQKARMAAAAFFKTANPEDEFFLVEFNDQPRMEVPLTRDVEDIQNHLTFAQSKGRTALLDAIFLAMHELKKSNKNRKALLIISDGGDNSSRYSEAEVRTLVREADVLIYAIGVFEPYGSRGRTPEESGGPGLLNDLCEQTGGRHLPADVNELADIAGKIGVELRNRYVLGYSPTNQLRDGRYHTLQVKVIIPKELKLPVLRAYFRHGYYAPTE
jgi:VWFA-related protein